MIAKIVIEKKMDKKHEYSEELSKYDLSDWDAKACKRTSDGAGSLMAVSGYRYMNQIREETQAMSLALMIYSLQQKKHQASLQMRQPRSLLFANCNWYVK